MSYTSSEDQDMGEIFPGFDLPKQNWSKLPHALVEVLYRIDSMAELKIVLYVLRHTWGYQEFGIAKRFTIDEFMNGRKRANKARMDRGTGLSRNSVKDGLKRAVEHGFLVKEPEIRKDRGRASFVYSLRMSSIEEVSESDTNDLEPVSRGSEFDPLGVNISPPEGQILTPDQRKKLKKETVAKIGSAAALSEFDTSESNPPERVRCSIHDTWMIKRGPDENGDIWHSHKVGGQWCKGTSSDQWQPAPPSEEDDREERLKYISGKYSDLVQY